MIYGQDNSVPALEWIKSSAHVFHLTGSRYFGNQSADSDWDFFVQDKADLQQDLERAGFKCDEETYPGDPMFTSVWKKDNVHVQVVIHAGMKQKIQERLIPFMKTIKDKDQRKKLWYLACHLYKDGVDGVSLYNVNLY